MALGDALRKFIGKPIWASSATAEIEDPDSIAGLSIALGYDDSYSRQGGQFPEREGFNWLYNVFTALTLEFITRGVVEWDTAVSYVHPAAVLGSDGGLYRSVQNSQGEDPTADTNSTYWDNTTDSGWSPELAAIEDGNRLVLQLASWVGGDGSAPVGAGLFVGTSGLVATAALAADIRGTRGRAGINASGSAGDSFRMSYIRSAGNPGTPTGGDRSDPKPTGYSFTIPTGTNILWVVITTLPGGSGAISHEGPIQLEGSRGRPGVGSRGSTGNRGWSAILAVVSSGARRVLQISSWTGGQGTAPASGGYIGSDGQTSNINNAVDIRGATGTGQGGPTGNRGWSSILAVVSDGARRVHQIADWVGGQGTKPATGGYLTETGTSTNIGNATDIRGSRGAAGSPAQGMPAGAVIPFGGASAPGGWLLCDGSLISRSAYSGLFTVIGEMFGPGNGSSTFTLPDMRRRVPMGAGGTRLSGPANSVGDSGGAEMHTLTGSQLPGHRHQVVRNSSANAGILSSGSSFPREITNAGENSYRLRSAGTEEPNISRTSIAGLGGSHNNVPPSLVLNYIIKT